eukprot:GDKJ01060064.1.p1 GENE.GDKJ01060064.1~~GDKJ01060064.1.p1  ORF type:complete len:333 (-),score=32.39 GDKJ01060064.1:27-1025(-)
MQRALSDSPVSLRIQMDEINACKRVRHLAQVAQWEAESKALAAPMVKIKAMLGEAAKQELGRIKSYHDRYLATLETFKESQLTSLSNNNTDNKHQTDASSRDSKHGPMTEARLNQRIRSLSNAAAAKARSLAIDVLISYKRLIVECITTNERIVGEAKRVGKTATAIAADEEFLASHAMMLHSSLFPWRDGILFECPSAETKSQLIAKGWASVGHSGRLQFHTFAASTVVSQLKQASQDEKRQIVSEANMRLGEFLAHEAAAQRSHSEYLDGALSPQQDYLPLMSADLPSLDGFAPAKFLTPCSSYSSDDLSATCGISGESDRGSEICHGAE